MFKGSIPALITPFKNGEIDWPAFENFIEWQIEQGSHGLVPCGTTGESPTLTHEEHNQVIERCIAVAAGRVPVIAGTGSNSTREAIELTRHAKEAGADAALIITPYYNKPSQEGMYQHYKAINDAVDIPIILYNVPWTPSLEKQLGRHVSGVARDDDVPSTDRGRHGHLRIQPRQGML